VKKQRTTRREPPRPKPPASPPVPAKTEKLHKIMADAGLGSRREMERWIEAGRVSINGTVAALGARAGDDDQVLVDGAPLHHRADTVARILIMNKADGVVCTRRDPEGRPTCFDGLPRLSGGRWVVVGRLDINSSGLLLLTNDGALAHRLMHPSTGIDREYAVRVAGVIDDDAEKALREGVLLDDTIAKFSDIARHGGTGYNQWYHVTLTEGRNREVRRLLESQGVQVSRLKRVRYGPVVLPSALRRGHWREVCPADVGELYRILGLPKPKLAYGSRRDADSVLIPYPALRRVTA
jgi:23S rRNA pseudouridine2605 synthase